jgi:hypothetical protein
MRQSRTIDVFNGDADGLCALHQLRLADPRPESELVTGVKRDIHLLAPLAAAGVTGAEITVLDLSLDANRQELTLLLATNRVLYIDHHYAGELPASANLTAHIRTDPEICTSLIVDQLLQGRYRLWAVVGAFGDNLHEAARLAATPLKLSPEELAGLRELGELLNYNGYGKTTADLYFHPATMYSALKSYADPRNFLASSPDLARLRQGFKEDMERARQTQPLQESPAGVVYRLPDQPWCRRVAGVFMNERARADQDRAQALLVENSDGSLLVSVRAPLARRTGADMLCRAFPSGGGRPAAAGINTLPPGMLSQFLNLFFETFKKERD